MALNRKNKQILFGIIAVLAILIGIYSWFSTVHAHKPHEMQQVSRQPIKLHNKRHIHPTGIAVKPKPVRSQSLQPVATPPLQTVTVPESAVAILLPHDTVILHKDTTSSVIPPCVRDTVPPHVHAEPVGGVFDTSVIIKLIANKPCAVEWKRETDTTWNNYGNAPVHIDTTTTITIRAVDSCNNAMSPRSEVYEIRKKTSSPLCPAGMVLIDADTGRFCIDMYEWPNKKGIVPTTYVSYYQAADSCSAVGKRLCTSDEWMLACSGPNKNRYPYGQDYDIHACVTNDTVPRPSGSRRTCKGYFDVFDMSGNCAEWTSTRSKKYNQYYNIMGGFWESGRQSSCYDVRYSYYPQNRHNPVGFRCCRDIVSVPDAQQGVR